MSDVAIVGAGVVGASIAYWLTRLRPGLDVTLIERDRSFRGASSSLSAHDTRAWKTISPSDRFGVNSVTGIAIADDETHYAYSARRVLSSLFAAEGW